MIEFKEWPKTPRLLRDITITEKIDGTNAAIGIVPSEFGQPIDPNVFAYAETPDGIMGLYAQSRKRLITPVQDNYGFATWVDRNADELVRLLGEGLHYGEWWGNGIQRKYGMAEKHFALFNTARFNAGYFEAMGTELNISGVPVLYEGPNNTNLITQELETLREYGSVAAPGFMNPEGICVYHAASRTVSKVTLDQNDAGKWEAAA